MKFQFEPLRSTQAAALLTKCEGGRINYTKLLKLLYLADRESLIDTGSPITGDRVVNMPAGPVLSTLYDCTKGPDKTPGCTSWHRHFRKDPADQYYVVLEGNPGEGELSDYDVDLLTALANKYRDTDWRSIVEEVHQLPEWHDPREGGQRVQPLAPEEILRAAGLTSEEIEAYEARAATAGSLGELYTPRA